MNIVSRGNEDMEVVYCLDGPLQAYRKMVPVGADEATWPDLKSGKYVRTEDSVAEEAGFMYVPEEEKLEEVRRRHLTRTPPWAKIVDRREKRGKDV